MHIYTTFCPLFWLILNAVRHDFASFVDGIPFLFLTHRVAAIRSGSARHATHIRSSSTHRSDFTAISGHFLAIFWPFLAIVRHIYRHSFLHVPHFSRIFGLSFSAKRLVIAKTDEFRIKTMNLALKTMNSALKMMNPGLFSEGSRRYFRERHDGEDAEVYEKLRGHQRDGKREKAIPSIM